jgi:hypothetical protein
MLRCGRPIIGTSTARQRLSYTDNAFTPLGPRQLQHYRVHTMYRPKPWATISGAFNDLERHNNTNNTGTANLDGPLGHDHVDHSRIASLGAVLAPNEHYGFDFNYSYSDVYTTTNICYLSGAYNATTVPGGSFLARRGLDHKHGREQSLPKPADGLGSGEGLHGCTDAVRVDGAFADAEQDDSLRHRLSHQRGEREPVLQRCARGKWIAAERVPVSVVNLAWTVNPGWIWRAEYNYYGYGEGGPSGAPFCSTGDLCDGGGCSLQLTFAGRSSDRPD